MFLFLDAGEDVLGNLRAGFGVEDLEVRFVNGRAEFEAVEISKMRYYTDEDRRFGASIAG